ncbi:aldo-keto reductase family 1 member B1-like [Amphiura filiformis]|uniref:aldo-keto reductase family 1 member B1-like n=1 Tax=Amphiura filiformis TaxID=82378 RepID=UPI003B21097B
MSVKWGRKPHHPLEHKLSVVRTLIHRSEIVTDPADKEEEVSYIKSALRSCGYRDWSFLRAREKKDKSNPQETVFEPASRAFTVTLPYFEGTSERLRRAFNTAGVPTAFKPHQTLRQTLVSPKDKVDKLKQSGTVYKIACAYCHATYIGESGRTLEKRLAEHKSKAAGSKSAVQEHVKASKNTHQIDWDNFTDNEIVTMAANDKFVKFPSGAQMPIIGLGTFQPTSAGDVTGAVKHAISVGYRHIDAATFYDNEQEVGAGIKAKINDGTVKREDLFITTKIWNTDHHPDDVEAACQKSLDLLGLKYLDLYLIHSPMAYKRGKEVFPKNADGKWQFADTDYVDTYMAMEKLVASGKCKAIGLSNFNKQQIERVMKAASIPVANLQIEMHPYLTQNDLVNFCQSKGITVTAFSPLGNPDRPWIKDEDPRLFEDPVVKDIAAKKGKSAAQILIRFALQQGVVCIPKSVTPSRIESNFESLNFELNPEEVKELMALNRDFRVIDLTGINHKDHPWFPYKPE